MGCVVKGPLNHLQSIFTLYPIYLHFISKSTSRKNPNLNAIPMMPPSSPIIFHLIFRASHTSYHHYISPFPIPILHLTTSFTPTLLLTSLSLLPSTFTKPSPCPLISSQLSPPLPPATYPSPHRGLRRLQKGEGPSLPPPTPLHQWIGIGARRGGGEGDETAVIYLDWM